MFQVPANAITPDIYMATDQQFVQLSDDRFDTRVVIQLSPEQYAAWSKYVANMSLRWRGTAETFAALDMTTGATVSVVYAPETSSARIVEVTAPAKTYTVTVPPVFFRDTVKCDCFRDDFTEVEVGKGSRLRIQATLTERDLDELHHRAEHYATSSEYVAEFFGLVASARATVKAIDKQIYGKVAA